MVCAGVQSRYSGFAVHPGSQSIPECHSDIAQPALMPNAPDCAAFQSLIEFFFTPRKQINQRRTLQTITRIKVGQHAALREFIPWAGELTVITSEYAITYEWAKLDWYAALELNREI
jgi:hypothetical protein